MPKNKNKASGSSKVTQSKRIRKCASGSLKIKKKARQVALEESLKGSLLKFVTKRTNTTTIDENSDEDEQINLDHLSEDETTNIDEDETTNIYEDETTNLHEDETSNLDKDDDKTINIDEDESETNHLDETTNVHETTNQVKEPQNGDLGSLIAAHFFELIVCLRFLCSLIWIENRQIMLALNGVFRLSSPPSFRQMVWRHSSGKLFVGGLSYDTNEPVLKEAFGQHGEIIEVKVICDHKSGKSKGYGFVHFISEDSASKALAEMDGRVLDGRNIRIQYANKK
ncbi:hypothetical protein QVD17_02853 [Tagetes erecta]|uniref:RRM domain-containing protein n=1 Tax=Tagetes erecta TaxID=13708 RepID=A0AAD8L9X4_TARER|nr:hypothetical protein QVD17_02853 [Tagetes erecta]